MTNQKGLQRGMTMILVIANLCLFVVYVGAWTSPQAQNNKKTVVKPRTLIREPLELEVIHRGNAVKINEEFEGSADWVKNISVKLKNRTAKTITYILIDLDFPEAASIEGAIPQYQATLGNHPDIPISHPVLSLGPGESTELSFVEGLDRLKNLITQRLPIENLTKVEIRIHQVLFDDETLFSSGSMYRRNKDTSDSRKWIPIDN
jgi:hypothetical protein